MRKNAIPLGAVCYLLIVIVASEVVGLYDSDSAAVLTWTFVAALPGVIALLIWWAWRRAGR